MDFLMGYIGQKLGFLKGVYASELGICPETGKHSEFS